MEKEQILHFFELLSEGSARTASEIMIPFVYPKGISIDDMVQICELLSKMKGTSKEIVKILKSTQ